MDPAKVFPYVVPAEYLRYGPKESLGLSRPLGHGLHTILVLDMDGLVRNVVNEDLTALRLTPEQAYAQAITNLESVARSGAVGQTMFPTGPHGRPFLLFGGHWTAATCILLPRLREVATKALKANSVYVSIPHRDALLVFAKLDDSYRREMIEMIREKESDGPKPLT